MDYKVETKNSLWEVTLRKGCYSDRTEDHYFFSGNSEEEVWHFVKLWAKMDPEWKQPENPIWEEPVGLVYNGEKFLVRLGTEEKEEDVNWDVSYGAAFEVYIKRLEVIYVNPAEDGLSCSVCGKIDPFTVRERACGFSEEINNIKVMEVICDACEREHLMDI